MKSQLINSMVSFTLGTGASLVALAMWTGTADLQAIKDSVVQLDNKAEEQAQAFISNYTVAVDNANAEIGEYKQALEQANSNISQLITAYEKEQAQAEQDLADLEQALADMQTRLDQQYETDMNAIIEQANGEINKANEEVAEAKDYVDEVLQNSSTNMSAQDRIAAMGKVLDTEGDKTVTSIDGVIGEVVEGE